MTNIDATTYRTGLLAELATATRVPGAVPGILADGHRTVGAHGVLSDHSALLRHSIQFILSAVDDEVKPL